MGALILALLAVVAPALPQQPLPGARVRPIVGPVRDAGILHVATNTWTRKAGTAQLGVDVVYDNTCSSGYYSALSGDTYVDEGRLPSPTSPASSTSRPGCAEQYTVDGFQFGYCNDTHAFSFELAFYESYAACTSVVGVTPTATLLVGAPGCNFGTICCWIATIDLEPHGGFPGAPFVMHADGDGTYSGAEGDNLFGWSIRAPTVPPGPQQSVGPIVAGDPNTCSRFDGTRWDSPVNYGESGTGMGTVDGFRIESGPTPPGCTSFPGVFSSFHLQLYAYACEEFPGTAFCFGDGTGTPCPCANDAPAPGTGCLNSLGRGGRMGAIGVAMISHDTVVLRCDGMTPNAPTLYFQGTLQQNGGAGTAFGDGKRCAGGATIRLGVVTNTVGGGSRYPGAGDPSISTRGQITAPGTRTYQAWYRNAASFCTPSTFNLTNGLEIVWTG